MEGLNTVGHAINNEKSYLDAGCKALLGCTAVAAFIVKNCIPGQLTGIKNDIAFERRSAELEEPFESLAVDIVCHDIFPPKYLLR